MRELRIHFTIDQQAKQELEHEVNDYLELAHIKGICLNIDKFEFKAAEIFYYKNDENLTYTVKAKMEGQYDDSIYVIFEGGKLARINFFTWYYDSENVMVTFEGGKKPFETGREMTVTKEGNKALMYKMSKVEEI